MEHEDTIFPPHFRSREEIAKIQHIFRNIVFLIISIFILIGVEFEYSVLTSDDSYMKIVFGLLGATIAIVPILLAYFIVLRAFDEENRKTDEDTVHPPIVRSREERTKAQQSYKKGAIVTILAGGFFGGLFLCMGIISYNQSPKIVFTSLGIGIIIVFTLIGFFINKLVKLA